MVGSMAQRSAAPAAALTLMLLLAQLFAAGVSAGGGGTGIATAVGPAVADTEPPTAPTNFHLISRTKGGQITLGWTSSTDDVGVASYSLYRDGRWVGTLTKAGTDLIGNVFFDRLAGRLKTAVTYDLYATDAAGNVSAPASPSVVVAP